MTLDTKTNSWMWYAYDTVFGLHWDQETGLLYWQEGIGCHCDDADVVQPMTSFLAEGAPGVIGTVPADVLAEIEAALGKVRA